MMCLGVACWNACTTYQVYTDACRKADIIYSSIFFISLALGLWWLSKGCPIPKFRKRDNNLK